MGGSLAEILLSIRARSIALEYSVIYSEKTWEDSNLL